MYIDTSCQSTDGRGRKGEFEKCQEKGMHYYSRSIRSQFTNIITKASIYMQNILLNIRIFMYMKIKKYANNFLLCAEKFITNLINRINYYNLLLFTNFGISNY